MSAEFHLYDPLSYIVFHNFKESSRTLCIMCIIMSAKLSRQKRDYHADNP